MIDVATTLKEKLDILNYQFGNIRAESLVFSLNSSRKEKKKRSLHIHFVQSFISKVTNFMRLKEKMQEEKIL